AQGTDGDQADVETVDADPPGGQLVKTWDQIDERGLAGSAGAHERNDFSTAGFQADVLENRDGTGIGKADIVEGDLLRKRREGFCARFFRVLFVEVKIREHLSAGTLGCLKLLVDDA